MKFEKFINESNPESRIARGPYASLYPKQYGLSYKMQYNPKSLKENVENLSSSNLCTWYEKDKRAQFWTKDKIVKDSVLVIDGNNYRVKYLSSPEDMEQARGGPIAKSMRKHGYSHIVHLERI